MLVCRNCKKIIMYSIRGYCEECATPERLNTPEVLQEFTFDERRLVVLAVQADVIEYAFIVDAEVEKRTHKIPLSKWVNMLDGLKPVPNA